MTDQVFVFTHGCGSKFKGGWTEVVAPDFRTAVALFDAVHPGKDGLLDCCLMECMQEFTGNPMFTNGNFGKKCVERISVTRFE